MPFIFLRYLSRTHMDTIPEIIQRLIRLGTNEDFANVCNNLHKEGIRVVLDGVFNHVGRGFWAFQDVLKTGSSPLM